MMDIKEEFILWLIKFNKNSAGRAVNFNVKSSEQLAKELHKAIIRKF